MWTLLPQRLRRLPKDNMDPLARDRAILVEVFGQLVQMAKLYERNGWDATPFQDEAKRVHLRLILVQMKLEEKDHD